MIGQPFFLLMSLCCGAVSAYVATRRGNNPLKWFIVGFLLGLIGIFYLICFDKPKKVPIKPDTSAQDPSVSSKTNVTTIDILPKVSAFAKEKPWYYLDKHNHQKGPISFEALKKAWKSGEVSEKTYVWNESLETWTTLNEFL